MNSGRLVRIQDVTMFGRSFTTLGLGDHLEDSKDQGKELLENSMFNLYSTTIQSDNSIRSASSLKIQSTVTQQYLSTKGDKEWTEGKQGGGGNRQVSRAAPRNPSAKTSLEDLIGEVGLNESGIKGTRNKGKKTGIYNPLDEDVLYNNKNNVIELNKTAANEDVFMISLVEPQEVEDLLFAHTVSTQLYSYTKLLRADQMDMISQEMYDKVINILSELIFFITKTDSNDPETCEGYPIISRQKLMRELRIVDLLID